MIEEKFKKIQEPLLQKRAQLEKDKTRHQFVRDVEDEDLWINETLPLAVAGKSGHGIFVRLTKRTREKTTSICYF